MPGWGKKWRNGTIYVLGIRAGKRDDVKRIYPGRGGKIAPRQAAEGQGKHSPPAPDGGHRPRQRRERAWTRPRPAPAPAPGAQEPWDVNALRWLPGMAAGSGGVTAGPPRSCRGERPRRGERWPAAAHQQLGDTGGRAAAGAKVAQLPPTFSQSIPASPPAPSFSFFFFPPPDINAMAQPSPPPSACPSGCHETWLGANKPPTYLSIYIAIVFLNGCSKGKQSPGDCVPRGQHKLAADWGGRNHL